MFSIRYYYITLSGASESTFEIFTHKPRQFIVECYLHWTTTFEISFSGSSDAKYDVLLQNITYTRPPRLRYFFQVVQIQSTTAYCRILPAMDHHIILFFSEFLRV